MMPAFEHAFGGTASAGRSSMKARQGLTLQASERMLPARGPFADGSSSKLTR